jgi:ketosteroid isomerase-like protein
MLSKHSRTALFLLLAGLILASCSVKTKKELKATSPATNANEALIETDCAFASLAADSGLAIAFATYAADSATILRDGALPIVGREEIRKAYSHPSRGVLTWEPYFADVGKSHNLGYTLGNYQFTVKDSTGAEQVSHGYYVTIWKKQPDGAWKYVLDTGCSGPPEKK